MPAKSTYLIAGEDNFLRNRAIKKIKDGFNSDNTPLIFYSDTTNAREVVDACRTNDMLVQSAVVIYRIADNIMENDLTILNNYIAKPHNNTLFIIEHEAKYLKGKKPLNKLSKIKLIECNHPRLSQVHQWVKKLTQEKNKIIESEAMQALVSKCGNNLQNINNALDKLCLYLKDENVIRTHDVAELVGFSIEYTSYNLIDEILNRNVRKALEISSRANLKDKDIISLVGLMAYQLNRMYKAKLMLKDSLGKRRIIQELGIYSFFSDKFFSQLNKIDDTALDRAIDSLSKYDYQLKTLRGKRKEDFDSLIIRLCAQL
jgi:DNA polymerase-3 subunit delta